MSRRGIIIAEVALILALLALAAGSVFTQVPPRPEPPAPPPYTPPDVAAVLAGNAPLRLLVASRVPQVAWKGEGQVRVVSAADGSVLHKGEPDKLVGLTYLPDEKASTLRRDYANFCRVTSPIRLESDAPIKLWTPTPDTWRLLAAPLFITPQPDGTFSVARQVMLEDYLLTVVPAEMPATFHPQALRAQAVVARTYTLSKLGRHADEGADLCETIHCQLVGPETKRAAAADQAVRATRGLVILYGDTLAIPYYHSTCGGSSDDAGDLWGPEYARPYLQGVSDLRGGAAQPAAICPFLPGGEGAFCAGSPSFRWVKSFTAAQVNALVKKNLSKVTGDPGVTISEVTNLAVERRTASGRVASLRVEGNGASVLVRGDPLRWLFGSGVPGTDGLWSTLFELTVARDSRGEITACVFRGGGRGHGIGLCQWGANGRGAAGQDFHAILHAYYPGTRLSDEKPARK